MYMYTWQGRKSRSQWYVTDIVPVVRTKSRSGKYKLRKDQLNICYIHPPTLPDYGRFDVTLLYTLIRNLCSSLKPTQGWGIDPKSADIQIGDDVERLRHFRNNYYAHANSSKISDTEFGGIWRNLKSAINRIQSSIACGADYEQQLNLIEQTKYTREHLENCKLILEAKVNSNAGKIGYWQDVVFLLYRYWLGLYWLY